MLLAVLADTVRAGWAVPVLLAVSAAVVACGVLALSPANEAASAEGAPAGRG